MVNEMKVRHGANPSWLTILAFIMKILPLLLEVFGDDE
jgi:hypothetical protein